MSHEFTWKTQRKRLDDCHIRVVLTCSYHNSFPSFQPYFKFHLPPRYLNDPTLKELSFANMQMPLPHVEKRVAPKLVAAIGKNCYLEKLHLQNSMMQSGEVERLGDSIRVNKCLRELDIEQNFADIASLTSLAGSLEENKTLEVGDSAIF